jgi:hypothetical protein
MKIYKKTRPFFRSMIQTYPDSDSTTAFLARACPFHLSFSGAF